MDSLFGNRHRSGGDFFYRAMVRKKRLYYVPGMISLIALPVLLFPFLLNTPNDYLRVLEIYFDPTEIRPSRNYLNIQLTGDGVTDKIKLDFARLQVQDIVASEDSLNGIHFQFENKSTYASFVRIHSDLSTIPEARYANSGNEMWLFKLTPHETPIEPGYAFRCGTSSMYSTPTALGSSTTNTHTIYFLVLTMFSLICLSSTMRTMTELKSRP